MEFTNPAQLDKNLSVHFERLKENAAAMNASTASQRRKMLKKLLVTVLAKREKITEALYADYQRHPIETELADTWVVVKEIKFAIRNVEKWMQPNYVPTSPVFFGSSSAIHTEAKGVVLILAPWNFPFNLTLGPLASAIAAGNTVMIKPSEFTNNSSHLLREIIEETFLPEQVVLIEGGEETSKALLEFPFNHVFFTGSERVGKMVMKAAANHLASVTLELGGKSPVIIDETVNLKKVAELVAYGKFCNNGQVCIGADYVYVKEQIASQFIVLLKESIAKLYPNEAFYKNDDYARIVNERQFERIKGLVDDAVSQGAVVYTEVDFNAANRFVAPVILGNISNEMLVNQQEIFGPILPIKTFINVEELPAEILAHGKPLAMYVFSKNKKTSDYLLQNISCGATVINEVFIHHFNSYLPFGGVNSSGIGKSHGHFGFLEFSNQKAVVKQWLPWHTSRLLHPPYTKFSKFVANILMRFFF